MNENQSILMAAGVWAGAWAGVWTEQRFVWSVPLAFSLAGVVAAVAIGRPRFLIVAVVLSASTMGARAERQHVVLDPQRYDGVVRLVTDPRSFGVGVGAEVRLESGHRVRLALTPPLAWEAVTWSAGQEVAVSGHLAPLEQTSWARARHLVGTLRVDDARVVADAPWWMKPSEQIRSAVTSSAERFDPDRAALYTGLVIGDDRNQSIGQRARFRTAGLGHLLAVSGQNVAFVLLVVSPVVRLCGTRGRLVAIAAVLFAFGVATRFEPSVLRATFTAAIAAGAVAAGRRSSGIHLLALAVSALLLIDPFLVFAVGFRLSVAASAGILLLGPAMARRIPGPRALVDVLAVTVAAQLAVLPLLFVFGPVSAISVPANVLVGWAAGLVMAWGMSVGLVVAQFPRWSILQTPAETLVWWVDQVAVWASRAPAPLLTPPRALILVGLAVVIWILSARARSAGSSLGPAGFVVCGLAFAWFVPWSPGEAVSLPGARYWPGGDVGPSVLVLMTSADGDVLGHLSENGIRSVDVVVLERGDRMARPVALAVIDQLRPGLVLAAPEHVIAGASGIDGPVAIDVTGGRLLIVPDGRRLSVSTE